MPAQPERRKTSGTAAHMAATHRATKATKGEVHDENQQDPKR
jgi:hypothetical protein